MNLIINTIEYFTGLDLFWLFLVVTIAIFVLGVSIYNERKQDIKGKELNHLPSTKGCWLGEEQEENIRFFLLNVHDDIISKEKEPIIEVLPLDISPVGHPCSSSSTSGVNEKFTFPC